jgi:hypothetical protein
MKDTKNVKGSANSYHMTSNKMFQYQQYLNKLILIDFGQKYDFIPISFF